MAWRPPSWSRRAESCSPLTQPKGAPRPAWLWWGQDSLGLRRRTSCRKVATGCSCSKPKRTPAAACTPCGWRCAHGPFFAMERACLGAARRRAALWLQGQDHEAAADLGGAVITGVNGNPLAVLARQLGIPMHRIEADQKDCPLYQSNGRVVSRALDSLVRALPALMSIEFVYTVYNPGARTKAGTRVDHPLIFTPDATGQGSSGHPCSARQSLPYRPRARRAGQPRVPGGRGTGAARRGPVQRRRRRLHLLRHLHEAAARGQGHRERRARQHAGVAVHQRGVFCGGARD